MALGQGVIRKYFNIMTTLKTPPVAALTIATLLMAPVVANGQTSSSSSETRPTATVTAAEPQTERVTVAAPSLDGNLLGDPSEVEVEVQTPGSVRDISRAPLPGHLLPRRL